MSRGLWNTAAQFAKRGYAAKAPWCFNTPLLSSRGGTTGITSGWAAAWCQCRPDTQKCSGLLPHGAPEKAPCCKAGRFSYVDLYWENRHLVSGLPFLVYTSEYSISGLRMCLQNGGSAVSWKSELKSAKLDGVLQAAEKGKLWQPGKYNEPAPEIVWCAQLPALFMVVVIKRWSVKNGK